MTYRTPVIYTGNIFHTLYSLTVIPITGIYTFLSWISFDKKKRIYNTRVYIYIYSFTLIGQVLIFGYHYVQAFCSTGHTSTVLQSGHTLYTVIVICYNCFVPLADFCVKVEAFLALWLVPYLLPSWYTGLPVWLVR